MWRRSSYMCRWLRRHYVSPGTLKLEPTTRRIPESEMKEDMEIEGFTVTNISYIPEFNMSMIKLSHLRTGCEYIHLARDDSNNVFSVGFRTTPTDSTGLPHILEHTTLCGSVRYPCRDPFFKMLNRSMATFMNAMTGPDYTIYPFATQNRTDFTNLMSVYLDAVFKPILKESDFKQEGWRLEHEEVTDKNSPIVIKGVVFNEMKGVFSENQSVFSEALLNNILPSHTYGVISGGNPLYIPSLSYNDLKTFHKKYYHPSNCRIYSYGNFPLHDHLNFVNKMYLSDFPDTSNFAKKTQVPSEPRWSSEKRKHIACRNDPMASDYRKQSSIAISVLCNDIKAIQETFVLQVLSELLVRGPNSAFYKTMVEPNIGGGFNPVVGYDSQTRDTIFSVGLSAVDPNDFEKIIEIYYNTINKVIEDGFEENNIKGILHNIELYTKHQSVDFGLGMLYAITPVWNHEGSVLNVMKVNEKVMKFKKSLADNPLYLQDVVQEYLKDNNHRLILTMSPEEEFEQQQIMKEADVLKVKINGLSPHQKDNVYSQGLELVKEQEAVQDVKCLPTLSTADLNKDVDRVKLKGFLVRDIPIQVCTVPTNGLTYLRGVLNTSILSDQAKSVLPLFCSVITKMGTNSHDYRQMDQMIQLKTGGLNFSTHIAENIFDLSSFEEGIIFSSFCLDRNVKPMCSLWSEIFAEVNLENMERFTTLVKVTASDVIHGIADSGHLYAMSSAASMVSPLAMLKEQFSGLTFVQTMKELSAAPNLEDALRLMTGITTVAFQKKYFRLALNTCAENEKNALTAVDGLLKSMRGDFKQPFDLSKPKPFSPQIKSIHHVLPYQVNYTAFCVPTVEYGHPEFPVLRVLAKLLSSKYLLPKIREKGGAYGAGANISSAGVFSFFSYRDPKPLDTFDIYNEARNWILAGKYSDQDVEEAKLGVFQSVDAPIPPGNKGMRNFLFGISDDELQKHREILMRLKREDIMKVSARLNSAAQGRALLGPLNKDLMQRSEENWTRKITE
ncbi:presequence protease, mitochondrial isoform X1 [Rhodnius prolixus]|uniref:presequence protease, mitochondrial isoform X1 n=1 Tax=Rhodnius prolixus TaxID=13249 RepID=UPI003D18F8FC